jgi:hypothetical protein
MAEHFEEVKICRSIVDGQRGYSVTFANGVTSFNFRLQAAFRELLHGLGHAADRDVMVVGEPEKEGNVW